MALQVCIMIPEKVFFNQEVEEIVLPTNTGQMGVLKNHASLVTALEVGVMLLRSKGEWSLLALLGGFAIVKENKVTILVNQAESPDTVDPRTSGTSLFKRSKKIDTSLNAERKSRGKFCIQESKSSFSVSKEEIVIYICKTVGANKNFLLAPTVCTKA